MRTSGLSTSISITTGGIVAGEYADWSFSILPAAVSCPSIDIYAFHGFTNTANWTSLFVESAAKNTGTKGVLVEEWGSQTGLYDFNEISSLFNENGIPWLYWEVTPGPDDPAQCTDIVTQDFNVTAADPTYVGLLDACQHSFDSNELGGDNPANLTALSAGMMGAVDKPLFAPAPPVPALA